MIDIKQFKNTGENRVFIFHHNDFDGYSGGAVLYKYFTEELGFSKDQILSKVIIYPTNDKTFIIEGVEPPTKEDFVVVVDYSITKLTKKYLNEIAEQSYGTLWIDHHKTSLEVCYKTDCTELALEDGKARLEAKFYKIVNMNYSGALLAYKTLYPNTKTPEILKYVDDFDRWVHKYPESKKLNAGFTAIKSYKDISDKYWRVLLNNTDMDNEHNKKAEELCLKFLSTTGALILSYDRERFESLINRIAYFGRIEHFSQYRTLVVNTQGHSSVFCGRLDDDNVDIGLLYYYDGKKYCYSIYSTKTDIDVSEIAKYYGGGGHKGAAGFFSDKLIVSKDVDNHWTPFCTTK